MRGEIEKVVGFELDRRIEPTGGFNNLWDTLGGNATAISPTYNRRSFDIKNPCERRDSSKRPDYVGDIMVHGLYLAHN